MGEVEWSHVHNEDPSAVRSCLDSVRIHLRHLILPDGTTAADVLRQAMVEVDWRAAEYAGRVVDDGPDFQPIREPDTERASECKAISRALRSLLGEADA